MTGLLGGGGVRVAVEVCMGGALLITGLASRGGGGEDARDSSSATLKHKIGTLVMVIKITYTNCCSYGLL